MAIEGVSLVGFTASYPMLTRKMQEDEPNRYNVAIVLAKAKEVENGMIAKKVYKASKNGTSIKFVAASNSEELKRYMDSILEEAKMLGEEE